MSKSLFHAARRVQFRWLAAWGAAIAAAAFCPAASANDVYRVEEDWELVVADPDATTVAPQVTTSISPLGHINGLHATFEINHRTVPSYSPGGLHFHVWNGESRLSTRDDSSNALVSQTGEVVRWTQRMTLVDNTLWLSVREGTSSTWGNFGAEGNLRISMTTNLNNLNEYSPEVSVAQSGIGFASNRAESLVLKRVRRTFNNGQVVEDNTPRVVYVHE